MKYFEFTKTQKKWNEDSCYAGESFAFVIDGASSLLGQKFTQCESDSKWYSKEWKEFLISNLDCDKSIFDILKEGIKTISKKYLEIVNDAQILDFPSATISLVRRKNGILEFYTLGDSPIVVKTKHGNSFLINDTRNNVNDDIRKAEVVDYARQNNMSVIEARYQYPDTINWARLKKNTIGHYYILSDMEKAVDFGYRFQIKEDLVDKILLLSDGYSAVFDNVGFMTSQKLIDKINAYEDAQKIYNKLVKLQRKDAGGDKYVRFSLSDDATLVCMSFR